MSSLWGEWLARRHQESVERREGLKGMVDGEKAGGTGEKQCRFALSWIWGRTCGQRAAAGEPAAPGSSSSSPEASPSHAGGWRNPRQPSRASGRHRCGRCIVSLGAPGERGRALGVLLMSWPETGSEAKSSASYLELLGPRRRHDGGLTRHRQSWGEIRCRQHPWRGQWW
jgi:hypothetical protein